MYCIILREIVVSCRSSSFFIVSKSRSLGASVEEEETRNGSFQFRGMEQITWLNLFKIFSKKGGNKIFKASHRALIIYPNILQYHHSVHHSHKEQFRFPRIISNSTRPRFRGKRLAHARHAHSKQTQSSFRDLR